MFQQPRSMKIDKSFLDDFFCSAMSGNMEKRAKVLKVNYQRIAVLTLGIVIAMLIMKQFSASLTHATELLWK